MSKSFFKRLRLIVLALFSCVLSACLVFGLSACGSSDKNKAEMTISLNHTSYTMAPAERDTLEIFVTQSDGKEYSGEYIWYSSDDSIVKATENENICIVEAVSVGTARVTCEVGNYSVFCTYNIVDVTDISFEPTSLEVVIGQEDTLKVTVSMSDGTTSDEFEYKLSEKGVVEISKNDSILTVKGVKTGSTTLTVTAGGKTASCEITVVDAEPKTHVHEYEAKGDWTDDYSTCEITLTCKNSDGLCDNVEVVIPAEDVTVSSTEVKADCTTAGSITYTATATYGGEEYTVTETVETVPATGHTFPAQGSTELEIEWKWEERDETASTVEVLITCTACEKKISFTAGYTTTNGVAHGTLTVGNNTYADEYTIEEKGGEETPSDVYTIEINEQNISLVLGGEENSSANLTATVTINGTVDTGVTVCWYSDSEDVASVDANGLVTAVGMGEAKIYAYITTDGGETISAYVVVKVTDGSVSEELVTKVAVDFSDSSTYAWMAEDDGVTIANDTFYSEGMLTLVSSQGKKDETTPKDSMTIDTSSGILKTGGSSSQDSGRYFVIDLTDYVGVYDYVSISAVMKTGSNGNARSLYLDTDYAKTPSAASETILSYVTSSQSSDKIELEYVCAITEDNCVLYLTCDANISIYSLTVEVGNGFTPTPEAESVTLSADVTEIDLADSDALTSIVTASVTMKDSGETYDGGYTWTVTDADGAVTYTDKGDGTLTLTAVATGSVTIEVRLWSSPKVTGTVTVKVIDSNSDEPQPEPGTGDEDEEPTLSVNKTAMSFNGIGQTDYTIYTLVGDDGGTYGGGSYEIKVETSSGYVATASYADGKISVTSVGAGSATITVTLMNGDDATEQIFTISVTVAISDITDGYTTTYVANATGKQFVPTADDSDATGRAAVGFSNTVTDGDYGTTSGGKTYVYDGTVTYSDYGGVNNSSKGITVTVASGVTADITVYASHTTSGNIRTLNIKSSGGDVLAAESIDGYSNDRTYLWAVTATNLSSGTYTISSTDGTIHVYAVVVTYIYNEGEVVEEEPTLTVNKIAMNFVAVGDTDYTLYTLVEDDGTSYSGGEYEVDVTTTNNLVASASAAQGGKITVTAQGAGSATIKVTLCKGTVATDQSFEIYVTVNISSFTENDTTYTTEYKAVRNTAGDDGDTKDKTGSFVATYDQGDENAESSTVLQHVVGEGESSNFVTSEKSSVRDSSVAYGDYAEIKQYDKAGLAITIADGVTADITVYASHTNGSSCRTIYISTATSISSTADILAGESIEGSGSSGDRDRDNLWPVTATNLGAGTYYVFSGTSDTVHVYAVVITYKYNEVEEEHIHVFDNDPEWTWTENDDGYSVTATLTCSEADCDKSEGYYFTETVTVTSGETTSEPTCGADGSMTYTATVNLNGKDYSNSITVEIPATGDHDWVKTSTTATCTEDGEATYTCSVCGATKTESETALGHDYVEDASQNKDATCTEDGVANYKKCSRCGDEQYDIISATGHSYVEVVTEPTCTERGYTTHTCSVCQDTYTDGYVDALGHSFPDDTDTTRILWTWDESTAKAHLTVICGRCSETIYDADVETVEKENGKIEPGCTTSGEQIYTAKVEVTVEGIEGTATYEEEFTKAVPAAGHTTQYTGYLAPTCTADGHTEYWQCSACGEYFADENGTQPLDYDTDILISKTGHSYPDTTVNSEYVVWDLTDEENLNEGGTVSISVYCTKCKELLYEAGATITSVETQVATGDENGYVTYTATAEVEGETVTFIYTRTLAATGHSYPDPDGDYTNKVVFDWDNMKDGKVTVTIYCADCGKEMETQTVDYSYEVTTAASCDSAGVGTYSATVYVNVDGTDYTYYGKHEETIPATGHSYPDADADNLENYFTLIWTVGEEGNITVSVTFTCKNAGCDHTETVDGTVTVGGIVASPSCTETGLTSCTATFEFNDTEYSMTENVVIPAIGHSLKNVSAVAATCETDGTIEHWKCSTCGALFANENGEEPLSEDEIVVKATGHLYPNPENGDEASYIVWSWNVDDVTGEVTTTVTITCMKDGCSHTETPDVTVTEGDKVDPGCETAGSQAYTASAALTFTYNGVQYDYTYTDDYSVEIEATGHSYPSSDAGEDCIKWSWGTFDGENTTASVTLYCGKCNEEIGTYTTNVSISTSDSTCTNEGTIKYTATVTLGDITYTDVQTETIPMKEHTYPESGTWTWSDDGTSASISFVCTVCGNTETVNATVDEDESKRVEATCTTTGSATYVATAEFGGKTYTEEKTVETDINSDNHIYPDVEDEEHIIWTWDSPETGKVTVTFICTCGEEFGAVVTEYYESQNEGYVGYWEASVGAGGKTYTGYKKIPEQSSEETNGTIVEVDFTDGSFTVGTVIVDSSNPADSALIDNQGIETGFTAKGGSGASTTQITTQGDYTVLSLGGSATKDRNSLAYYLTAGTYKVVVSYFQGNSGRWATVLDSTGNDWDELVAEEDKTSGQNQIKTREILFTLPSDQYIYIGSKTSGLYITFIGIYSIESIDDKTIAGVTLDVTEMELVIGDSIVVSAIVELSDGKNYIGYSGVTYNWTFSGDTGSISYDGSGDNITVTGISVGSVSIKVSLDDTNYEALCTIAVIESDVPELGDMILSDKVDFSDSTTYTWISESAPTSSANVSIANEQTLTEGIFTLATGNSMEIRYNSGNIALYTNGKTQNGVAYIEIDLSEYVGSYVTINAEMSNTGSNNGDRYLMLSNGSAVNSIEDEKVLVYVASSANGSGHQTLTKSLTVTRDYSKLYLTWDASIYIYNFSVEIWSVIDDSEPIVTGVTLSRSSMVINVGDDVELTATVTMNKGEYTDGYEWTVTGDTTSIQTNGSSTGSTYSFKAVEEGNVTITVTAGEKSASCTIKILAEGESAYEWVETSADFSSAAAQAGGAGSGNKSHGGISEGKFYFSDGSYFEDTSSGISGAWDINTQGKDITFTVTGTDNNVSFNIQSASGSGDLITLSIYSSTDTGNVLYSLGVTSLVSVDYYSVVGSYLPAGTYVIHTSSSARISGLTVSEYVEISEPDCLEVVATNVDFIYGRTISDSELGLVITLVYKNGRRDALSSSQVTTDLSTAQNNFKVGANTVRVTYNYDGTEYYADIVIYLYEVESITVSDFSMSYTGGTYYTNNVQKIFLVGDSFNHDYAAVTATAFSYDENGNRISATFILTDAEVIFTLYGPDDKETSYLNEEGVYTVKISVDMSVVLGDSPETEYTVSVVDKTGANITTVYVEQGAKAELKDGYFTVGSINDAIQLIKLLGASDKERKFIYVGAGQYWEKIYIDIPNLSLIGSNSPDKDKLATRQDSTTGGTEIVFWAMNGLMDPSGTTTYSTVGGATVTVAEQAVGFYAANITFRNYWNTNDLYNQALKITSATQADAAYINADQSYFYNVTFTGYHDTLEAENGRQVYDHCYIEGRTDYIFGNTATCYFTECTIHTIGSGSSTNGGYVMAIKGGTDDKHVDYGYIFNECDFITDLEEYYTDVDVDSTFAYTVEGTVSVARTWSGNNMHIAILNSTFDNGFSTKEYGDTTDSKNARYTIMSAGEYPTKEYLIEYNNEGAGAISDTNYGTCTILTDENAAADYLDMDTIFADVNGGITYTNGAWDGSCYVIEITVKDSSGETVTTVYATGSMSVSDLKDAINLRLPDNDVEAIFTDSKMTTELTGSVKESSTVYISLGEKDISVSRSTNWDFTHSGYESTSVSGYLDDDEWLYLECGEGGSLTNNGDNYLLQTGATLKLVLRADSVLCVGTYFTESVVLLDSDGNDVTADGSYPSTGANKVWPFTYTVETAGEYTICAGSNFYLCYINVSVSAVTESTTISFRDSAVGPSIQGGYGWYGDVYVDATASGAKFEKRTNGDVQTAAGTVLYIQSVPGASASINWYPSYSSEYEVEVDETGLIKITIGSQENSGGAYIYDIVIVIPTVIQVGEYINFKNFGSENNLNGASGTFNGIIIDATNGYFGEHNNGECVMVNAGTVITIYSVSGASAELDYYPGYSEAAKIDVDENGVITITFTTQTYLYGITIVSDGSPEELPDEGQEDEYTGSITLTENEITITVGEAGNIEFEYEVSLNGEPYEGIIDIAVESDDTYIAVDSWDGTSNSIVVRAMNKGDTLVTITLSVNGKVLDTVSVTVHVEATAEEPQITTKEYSFSYEELCNEAFGVGGTVTDKSALDADYFTGSNAFLTYTGSYSKDWSGSGDPADNIRTSSCIEVKGDVLQVTFEGTGTISISFASTGSSNTSTLGLRNEAGYYLQGNLSETSSGYGNTTELTISDNSGYYYKVTNTSYVTVEFVITEPGTYTIATSMEATVLKLESFDDNRASRINSIVMIDNVVSGGTTSEDNPSEHTYPEANDTVHVVWDWEDRTEDGYVQVTITCVDCGETIVSEWTEYIIDENNKSYWIAEVAEGDITYSSTYKIPGEGSVYIEESFIVPVAGSADGVTSASFNAGDVIVDNSLFTLTAVEAMQYSAGATYGNISGGSAIVTFTDMSNTTQNPDQGIQTTDTISANGGTKDNILSFTANDDIHAYIYVSLGDNGFTGNRSGEIFYSMDGATVETKTVSARNEIFYIEIDMQKGQSISIGATNKHASSSGKLWLWGAEAYTLDGEKIEYGVEYTVTFNTNQGSIDKITTAVYNYSIVTAPVLPNISGYYFAGWYMNEKCTATYDFSEPVTCDLQLYAKWVTLDTKITYIEGAYEGIAFEFEDSNASGAKIYYKLVSDSSYTLMNDPDAVRQLDTETVRVDIIGLQGDEYYNVKILTSGNAELACYSIYVASYDRSGYAHFGYDEGVGAYEDDGTLKDGALVIYLTEDNKNDVTNDMYVYDKATDSYNQVTLEDETLLSCLTVTGSTDISTYSPDGGSFVIKGIGEILNTRRYSSRMSYGIGRLCQEYGAVVIRVIGKVTATVGDFTTVSYTDSKGVTSDIQVASYDIIGISDYNYTTNGGSVGDNGGMASMTNAHNVTIEGVGEDATIDGWGFCFMTANGGYADTEGAGVGFEVRNLTFKNYTEDAIGMEGVQADSSDVNSELTCPVERLWIHNNTFYVGYCANPVEEDKADGDGSCDFKRGRYLTVSFNYFEGCHKTNLFGANANSLQFDMTIHHNYYYNCSQRMPLVRNGNVHFYNNYIYSDDGNMQSAVYSRDGAYVYAEYNYFEGCKNPMMAEAKVSDAGTDELGYIKSYGNVLDSCDGDDQSDIVSSRTEYVYNTCTYPFKNVDYSSFDTDPTLFYYDTTKGRSDCYLTSAEQARKDVIRMAGAFNRSK